MKFGIFDHLDHPGGKPVPAHEMLRPELLVHARSSAAAKQIAHHDGAASIDVEHLVQAQHRVAKLREIAPPARALAPAAALQVVVHHVRRGLRRRPRDEVLERQAHLVSSLRREREWPVRALDLSKSV